MLLCVNIRVESLHALHARGGSKIVNSLFNKYFSSYLAYWPNICLELGHKLFFTFGHNFFLAEQSLDIRLFTFSQKKNYVQT